MPMFLAMKGNGFYLWTYGYAHRHVCTHMHINSYVYRQGGTDVHVTLTHTGLGEALIIAAALRFAFRLGLKSLGFSL